MMYLPGIAFLFIASALIAIPFAIAVKNKSLAIFLSVCISTPILKSWAYFAMGGFDLGFLIILIGIASCSAVAVRLGVDGLRRRIQTGA